MTVYVDTLIHWGWQLRGRKVMSCHMFTDQVQVDELHQLAEAIGMRRSWFQPHRIAPHYDLTSSRRADAVSKGAVEVDHRQAASIWRSRRQKIGAQQYRVQPSGDAAVGFPGLLVATCRICGCTDMQACPGGCWWVEPDLCSACAEASLPFGGTA